MHKQLAQFFLVLDYLGYGYFHRFNKFIWGYGYGV